MKMHYLILFIAHKDLKIKSTYFNQSSLDDIANVLPPLRNVRIVEIQIRREG
jgi:hypothetical protein